MYLLKMIKVLLHAVVHPKFALIDLIHNGVHKSRFRICQTIDLYNCNSVGSFRLTSSLLIQAKTLFALTAASEACWWNFKPVTNKMLVTIN